MEIDYEINLGKPQKKKAAAKRPDNKRTTEKAHSAGACEPESSATESGNAVEHKPTENNYPIEPEIVINEMPRNPKEHSGRSVTYDSDNSDEGISEPRYAQDRRHRQASDTTVNHRMAKLGIVEEEEEDVPRRHGVRRGRLDDSDDELYTGKYSKSPRGSSPPSPRRVTSSPPSARRVTSPRRRTYSRDRDSDDDQSDGSRGYRHQLQERARSPLPPRRSPRTLDDDDDMDRRTVMNNYRKLTVDRAHHSDRKQHSDDDSEVEVGSRSRRRAASDDEKTHHHHRDKKVSEKTFPERKQQQSPKLQRSPMVSRNRSPVPGGASPRRNLQNKSSLLKSIETSQTRTFAGKRTFNSDELSQRSYQSSSALPAVTTKDAKRRNYLVGSICAPGSLLGSDELERYFPDRKLRLFVGTWNMMEMKDLPDMLDDFLLPDACETVPDMLVFGTQESTANRREWEIRLQESLGPQHVLYYSASFGVLYLCIFLRRDLIWYSSVAEEASCSTRPGPTSLKTKGAVAVCFSLFGTSFLFVNAHFTPHDGKSKERIEDFKKICKELKLPKLNVPNQYAASKDDVTEKFDCVFWSGDLNCRIEKERKHLTNQITGLEAQEIVNYDDLMDSDELFRVRNEELAFTEFQEGRITFKPTYKYDVHSDTYDTSAKLRIPSYTDRILFRSRRKQQISCISYQSADSVQASDHRPVFGLYEVTIRPGRDTVALSAGQFSREVWLEGNRRRSQRAEPNAATEKSSAFCSVM